MTPPTEPIPAAALEAVDRVVQEVCGISLTAGLLRTLEVAVTEAADAAQLTPRALVDRVLARDEGALELLVERAVVGETSFFRHPEQFDALAAMLPHLEQGGPLLCWSAGCASGEEPYSLAMSLMEAGRSEDRIIATDVSEEALARARAARYGHWSLRRLRADRRARWFAPSGLDVEVVAGVRDRVDFRRHNLAADPPPWTFDVVLCRNVLIYFEPAAATQAMHRLLAAVRPGGLLVLGPVELPLAASLGAQWVERAGATVLRRPGGPDLPAAPRPRLVAGPASRPIPIHRLGPRFLAAREAVRSGHLADAERLAREAVDVEGGPEPWLVLAQVAEVRGRVGEAVALLRQALDVEPRMPVALASLSALLRLLGKPGLSEMARVEALRSLDGLADQHPLRGLEPIPAGALRRALLAAEPHPE